MPKKCSVDECENDSRALEMCWKHYVAQRRATAKASGEKKPVQPRAKFETPLDRLMARVEKTESCWEWTGPKSKGYGRIHTGKNTGYAHRVSYELHVGPIPEGLVIDHMCHNKACVNPQHLRVVTNKQNSENVLGASRSNKSCGVRGVTWNKFRGKWAAQVKHQGKLNFLGYFDTIAEAEAAAIAKRNELFTHNDADRSVA